MRRRLAVAIGFSIALLATLAPEPSSALSARSADPKRVWVTDGTVYTLAATPRGVFAGGDFTLIGHQTGSWVSARPAGSVVPVRNPVAGQVAAAVADGRGGWYVAGRIAYVGDVPSRGVVHLRADGRLDKGWKPHVKGAVLALARVRSTLYLGGEFTKVGHRKRLRLAAVDVRTGALRPWAPRVVAGKNDDEPNVSTLVPNADGKTIYVGGSFSRLGRKRRAGLGALDATSAAVRRWHPRVDGAVTALALDPRGRVIYAGGEFGRADGQHRNGLAAFELKKGGVTRWDPDSDGSVSQIAPAPSGSPIYVAGSFASIGEKSRRGVAAVDRRRGKATPWDPNVGGSVDALLLAPKHQTIFIAGEFASVGDADRPNLAAINTRTGAAAAWNPKAIGPVSVLARGRRGAIGIGGSFSSVGAARRTSVALFGLDGNLSGWAPRLSGPVRTIAASADGGRLYVGGRFTLGEGRTLRSLALLDPGALTIGPWGASINAGVWAIAPSGDGQTVYVGGAFTAVAGKTRRRLAALDATGALTPWAAGANALVRQLIVGEDQLWVAGDFASVGGAPRTGVASLDLATGRATGWDAGADDNVTALAVTSDNVFVGGDFTSIGGRSRKYLAELDAGDGSATRWDPSPDDAVNALGVSPDAKTLVAAGDFTKISGARRDIGEFDLATGFLTAWRPFAPFSAGTIAFSPDSSALFVAGEGFLAVYR